MADSGDWGDEPPSRVRLLGGGSSSRTLHPETWYRSETVRLALATRSPLSARALVSLLGEKPEDSLVGYHVAILVQAGLVDACPMGSGRAVGRSYRYALAGAGIHSVYAAGPDRLETMPMNRWIGTVAYEIASLHGVEVSRMYKLEIGAPRNAFARFAAALLGAKIDPAAARLSIGVDPFVIREQAGRWAELADRRVRRHKALFETRMWRVEAA